MLIDIFHNCTVIIFSENGLNIHSDVHVMNINETIIVMQTGQISQCEL